jgi:hypothetical protein
MTNPALITICHSPAVPRRDVMLISLEYGEWENQESRLRVYIWAKLKPALLLTSDPDTK